MRLNRKFVALLLAALVLPLAGCGFLQRLRSRDNLNKGVKAFTEQKYTEAAGFFQAATELDPEFTVPKMYLASTYVQQFIPGSPDPKNLEMADKAIRTFQQVIDIEKEPKGKLNAMLSIASLYYQLKRYDESKDWCRKILELDPTAAEAHYRIAVINFDDSLAKTGLQGENVEFMNDEDKAHTTQDIEEGLKAIDQALSIRPDYFDAMEYQNLLWREKAKLEKDAKVKAELIRQADLVAQKSLALKLQAAQEEAKKPKKLAK